jgi:hypothetical protein
MSRVKGSIKGLVQRRQAVASALPPFEEIVRGSLITRYRRCGKPACHCAGTEGHGPAHYLVVTLRRGKTEQILLSAEMLPVARRYLDNYNRWWAALEKVSEVNRRLLRMRVRELCEGVEPAAGVSDRSGMR